MLFPPEFVESIKIDPVAGVMKVCQTVFEECGQGTDWEAGDLAVLMEAYALLEGVAAAGLITLPISLFNPHAPSSVKDDCTALFMFFQEVFQACSAKAAKNKYMEQKTQYQALLNVGFVYEFTQGDLDQVQRLIGELRKQITESKLFEDDHRRRLLLKLEKLQTEIHKKMSTLDKFWSILGDAGVVVGKFGEDAKPMFDRMNEILKIVWRTQARAEDLPSDSVAPLPNETTSPTLPE
ncbi:hypothetical protein HZS47_22900 [Achromobacter xylosoxidans]|uniref:hypothetical protein n=1 Tax=Alcaligenes xylosoxydans xylosoxydans TaxID=85698 RepID=UPI0015CEB741|nr:hypothetical protein [Achromobacter xylosoxidans]NYS15696.1 hypothetical protein [Achromobacter xylosoxidans]